MVRSFMLSKGLWAKLLLADLPLAGPSALAVGMGHDGLSAA